MLRESGKFDWRSNSNYCNWFYWVINHACSILKKLNFFFTHPNSILEFSFSWLKLYFMLLLLLKTHSRQADVYCKHRRQRVRSMKDYEQAMKIWPKGSLLLLLLLAVRQPDKWFHTSVCSLSVGRWEMTFSWQHLWLLCCNVWHFIPAMMCQTSLQLRYVGIFKTLLFAVS